MNILEFLKEMPVIGILRDIPQGSEEDCVKVSAACGLKAIEVTMNTANAAQIIKSLKAAAKPYDIVIGAGTVRHLSDLNEALAAGAQFIVTPNTRHEIIRTAASSQIPIIPGALTPTEVQKAYDLGASAVKVFPVDCVGGPKYIKALRGPFRDIPLMACGGVNPENASDYIHAGATLLAFGNSIYSPQLMTDGNWTEIQRRLAILLSAVKAAL
ncbi:MAG: bifunctional 4-hydroxy-2-oxoglutarate aldolase/2-dehydro-3-deoxy-phosphogluconate aldolase [Fibrobacter sp.]|nr:bifunctional 4-hydroxy-2-oxoglutarate aldolase/2-dehydro-3-deoxy-phosphogluconate aldolase [Fibrobacter sp.]